jgi:hypothetical protein
VKDFVARISDSFGKHSRRWAYSYVLPDRALFTTVATRAVSRWEKFLFGFACSTVQEKIAAGYDVNDKAKVRPMGGCLCLQNVPCSQGGSTGNCKVMADAALVVKTPERGRIAGDLSYGRGDGNSARPPTNNTYGL